MKKLLGLIGIGIAIGIILGLIILGASARAAILNVYQGGTGWGTTTAGSLFVSTSSITSLTILPIGTIGNILESSGTTPQWVATSTLGLMPLSTGTTGYVTRWTSNTQLGVGILLDNATVAGANATSSTISFLVQGTTTLNPFQVNTSTGVSIFTVNPNLTLGINTTTNSTVLYVQGTSTYPTLPLLVVASSTGSNYLKIFADGGIAIATSTPDATTTMAVAGQYYSAYYDNGTSTATSTIDWGHGNFQRIGINAAQLGINFTNQKAGGRYFLIVQAATTTVYTINWQSLIHWTGGTTPTPTTGTYGQIDIATFGCLVNCYGIESSNFAP